MPKPRWTIEQKRQHVAAWRASGLTRQQYCELNDIPFTSLREWPQDVAKAERRANEPTVLPVHIAPPLHADVPQPVTNEPVTLFLPGGVRMCCQPSQLTDVFRALKYAQS
ncbi:IS66 family insertion sequence element accessory protein TnpB [Escherichia coli]|uniref:IS66 family insertion sequence element accessory protein TnpA n=1 Tax=Escherichia coli TaxID=562 RepID=UPI00195182ED|nr:IS66 family insertion sequence element accessory protein TnpB [Escherichia coli]QRP75212.1 IS66 family insertion sequence element accessory protein TnpB [Escherichia coli]